MDDKKRTLDWEDLRVFVAVARQGGYAAAARALGVNHATVARRPLEIVEKRRFCEIEDSRHLSVRFEASGKPVLLHNFYVPAGGDEPDPAINPKFRHKLDFVREMNAIRADPGDGSGSILVGDLNIAPLEHDVWSHKQMLKVVSHTPIEVEKLEAVRKAGKWVDAVRHFVPPELQLYSWWSYRANDWEASDRGRRLDHIWVTPQLVPNLTETITLREARGWEGASDHVPVMVEIK